MWGKRTVFAPVEVLFSEGGSMLHIAVVVYGLLLSFVLFSASRNKREGRAHARPLVYVGYVLCGLSAGAAVGLPLVASMGVDVIALTA